MAAFLAYFDLLGYGKFIEHNTENLHNLHRRVGHFARNVESALALDRPVIAPPPGSINAINDISQSTLDCIIFSDTVVFVTKGNRLEDFDEILKVSYKYNSFNVLHDFPSRGCIVYGDIWVKPFEQKNQRGGNYMANMIYGKALVDAHKKAEAMSWAGCVLDNSAINFAQTLGNIDALLSDYTMEFEVPYKTKRDGVEVDVKVREQALKLVKRIVIPKYYEDSIRSAFTNDSKGEITGRVEVIFNNTIEFLRAHCIFPFYYIAERSVENMSIQVFGRLEANYTHTTITRHQTEGSEVSYVINSAILDLTAQPDISFIKEPTISAEEFDEQLQNAAGI